MSNLMRAEFYKLFRNRTFWVLIVSLTGLSALMHHLIIIDWWMMTGTPFEAAGLSEFNALAVLIVPLFFNLIVSTLAGFYIANEFSQSGVIKNQIITGHKRTRIFLAKFMTLSFGTFIVAVVIPFLTAFVLLLLHGMADVFTLSNLLYLGRAYGLFTLQFLCLTAIVLVIAMMTEDSGKTVIFTLLLSAGMFILEKFVSKPWITMVYEHTFFYQFSQAFQWELSSDEIAKSIVIGILSLVVILLCGMLVFKKKEIK